MKEMSFRVATSSEVVARAIISDCKLHENETSIETFIEFSSEQIASAMLNALKDAGYDTEFLFLNGNCIGSYSFCIEFKAARYCNAVEIIWSEQTFNHIQVAEGKGCWLRSQIRRGSFRHNK